MRYLFLTIGLLLLVATVYLFLTENLIPSIIVLVVAAFFIIQDSRAIVAGKKITSLTYSSFIEHGSKQIEAGRTSISKVDFLREMDKIRDVISGLQFVPVVGFDSVYLQYSSEAAANNALSEIHQKGVNADIIQDKSMWSVRIHFS